MSRPGSAFHRRGGRQSLLQKAQCIASIAGQRLLPIVNDLQLQRAAAMQEFVRQPHRATPQFQVGKQAGQGQLQFFVTGRRMMRAGRAHRSTFALCTPASAPGLTGQAHGSFTRPGREPSRLARTSRAWALPQTWFIWPPRFLVDGAFGIVDSWMMPPPGCTDPYADASTQSEHRAPRPRGPGPSPSRWAVTESMAGATPSVRYPSTSRVAAARSCLHRPLY
jgi:hypothetical protein